MAVVGIDFFEPMFGGAGEVEGVCRTEEAGSRSFPVTCFQALLDSIRQGQPVVETVFRVIEKLIKGLKVSAFRDASNPVGAMERGHNLGLGVPGTCDDGPADSDFTHCFESLIAEVKPGQIGGIKIRWFSGHLGRRK